jgi:predicted NUDIX family phosphoesterase
MEFVYVVRRQDLFSRESIQGFRAMAVRELEAGLLSTIRSRGFFVERGHAEHDSSLKQIIPYCMVVDSASVQQNSSTREPLSVLCLRRLGAQGEKRLHDKLSIGIGGHLNPVDYGPADHGTVGVATKPGDANDRAARAKVVDRGVIREVSEELELDSTAAAGAVPIGVINDDSSPVGSVHFGIVYALAAPSTTTVREKEHMEGEFKDWRRLAEDDRNGANFETWSAILIRGHAEGHVRESLGSAPAPAATGRDRHAQGHGAQSQGGSASVYY